MNTASATGLGLPSPAESLVVVSTVDEVRNLVQSRYPRGTSLRLDLPGIEPEAARTIATRIQNYRRECGCSAGATFMGIGFGVLLLGFVLRYGASAALLWHLPWAVAGAIVCAGAGKAIGRWHSHVRLRTEVAGLIRRVEESTNEV